MLLLFALTQLLDAQGTDPLKERLDKYNTYLDLLNKGYFETDTVAATFREFISDYENKVRRIDTALDLMAADNYQEPASNIFLQANPNISPGEEQLRRQDPSLIDRYFNY